ncbi:MAG: hypothetical protein IIB31_09345 [Chloroflexi bacterium]|nr:hypothetical protein [Chloroflexota bacterium]
MRMGFLAIFVSTVLIAASIGIIWAYFSAPKLLVSEDGLKNVISAQRDLTIASERALHYY